MGIETLMTRTAKQIAVYWGNPVNDGFDKMTFDDPVEIYCRWEDKTQVIRDSMGKEIVSSAVVYPLQDLDEEGWLYLGRLTDLDSEGEDDPMTVSGAYSIKKFNRTPDIKGAEFMREAYL